jgi:5-dehydro-4-deoxyglucarate dehydratase
VTHFTDAYAFDEAGTAGIIEWLLEHKPAGLFAAGGTGEFFSLTLEEFAAVVAAAVQQTKGRVPVVAGCGYGTAMAKQFAQAAEAGGRGWLAAAAAVSAERGPGGAGGACGGGVRGDEAGRDLLQPRQRDPERCVLEKLCARCANLVGFKDGYGDIELMTRIYARMGDRLTYIGGLPTAETFALPYLEMGVTTYSSAIFNFLPKFAQSFYAAVRTARPCGGLQAVARVCAAVYRHTQPAQGLCGVDCEGGDARGGQAGGAGADAADGPGCGRDGCAEEADRGALSDVRRCGQD